MPVRVPARIDPATWARAPAPRVRHRERAQRHNPPPPERLRSLLVCGRGARRLVGPWSAPGGRSICARRYPRYGPGAGTGRRLRATGLEAWLWAPVKAWLSDPAVVRAPSEPGHGDPAGDVRAEPERVRLERKLAALDRDVTRLIDAYQAEVMALTELAARRRRLADHGRMLRERVRDIAHPRRERSAALRRLEGVDACCPSVREAMEEPSFPVPQKV